jgi:subtilisin family serine protease
MKFLSIIVVLLASMSAYGADSNGWLVKLKDQRSMNEFAAEMGRSGVAMKDLHLKNWVKLDISDQEAEQLKAHSDVVAIERNWIVKLQTNIEVQDPILREMVKAELDKQIAEGKVQTERGEDNPAIPLEPVGGSGSDPLFNKQWGMADNNVKGAWDNSGTKGNDQVVVAVIDTGVDYTHEDLVDNMWRNPGETGVDEKGNSLATNGIDDDGNGYVDDVVGWDFAKDDNKPYDLHKTGIQLLLGGNPGHGTHVAGCVAATGDNGKGISGVAPNVKMMAMRFLTEDGQGTIDGAIGSIRYAVDNGAHILQNSWGSEGDGGDQQASQALQDAIQYALDEGVLFVAAAGNGRQGVGYDNDADSKPAYPASYPHENIISVAAVDSSDQLGAFSNWGRQTVDIGAPGVAVFSTVPDNVYQDTVIDIPGLITATWDGTSMAAPHVSGAAALYLSKYPNADWRELKDAVLNTATPINALNGKSVSNGKLNVQAVMQY